MHLPLYYAHCSRKFWLWLLLDSVLLLSYYFIGLSAFVAVVSTGMFVLIVRNVCGMLEAGEEDSSKISQARDWLIDSFILIIFYKFDGRLNNLIAISLYHIP